MTDLINNFLKYTWVTARVKIDVVFGICLLKCRLRQKGHILLTTGRKLSI